MTKYKKEALKIINNLTEGERPNEYETDILLGYFKQHPKYEEKFKDFDYFMKNGSGAILIVKENGLIKTISKNFTKNSKDPLRKSCNEAFRHSIQPEIDNLRNQFKVGIRCSISGEEILDKKDLHIDHHNLEFKDIVKNFLRDHNLTYREVYGRIEKVGTGWEISSKILKDKFIEYHNDNTTLRYTLSKYNLSKIRK